MPRALRGLIRRARSALGAAAAHALQDAAVPRDRADQDRVWRDVCAGEEDAFAQLRAVADARAVAEHDRAHQPHACADLHVAPDPYIAVDIGVLAQRRKADGGDAGLDLLAVHLEV